MPMCAIQPLPECALTGDKRSCRGSNKRILSVSNLPVRAQGASREFLFNEVAAVLFCTRVFPPHPSRQRSCVSASIRPESPTALRCSAAWALVPHCFRAMSDPIPIAGPQFVVHKKSGTVPVMAGCTRCTEKFFTPATLLKDALGAGAYLRET